MWHKSNKTDNLAILWCQHAKHINFSENKPISEIVLRRGHFVVDGTVANLSSSDISAWNKNFALAGQLIVRMPTRAVKVPSIAITSILL